MACENLDATILLEEPPDFEFVGGLVYVTDRIGSCTIRRCMRASTFFVAIGEAVGLAREYGTVVPLHAATGKSSK